MYGFVDSIAYVSVLYMHPCIKQLIAFQVYMVTWMRREGNTVYHRCALILQRCRDIAMRPKFEYV
jgi:hypothetical protein